MTAASYSRPTNTANPEFTGTINGMVNTDNITANYSCAATVSSPVGTYPIVPTLVDPNNRRTNYTVNLVNGILVIGHPTQVNTWTNPAPIIYGTPLSSVQLDESVNVVGTYAYTLRSRDDSQHRHERTCRKSSPLRSGRLRQCVQ